ncbi:MlaD family protein [Roseomonas sp. HF4]|uniref:MlaD family protein n=1 Tax=Roseomonas sp. HF4 TaxID=2562313 RepID=UPI0010BFDCA2|nr:MlaD family protein [Roseomonas sp. HF4]
MPQAGRSLYLRVGVLVLAGLGLAFGFVLYFTAGRLGGQQQIFETYIRESVAGLDVGAPVRFRGVPVGRVTELGLVSVVYGATAQGPDDTTARLVLLRFAVDPERYGRTSVETAVAAGLRVRIASSGVTGLAYLEIDFTDPERAPPIEVPWTPTFQVIPSVPSTITQVTSAAERLMTQLAGLDIEALIEAATGMMNDVRGQLRGQGDLSVALREASATMVALREAVNDIRGAARTVGAAGEAAQALLGSEEVAGAAGNVGQAAADLRVAIARLPAVLQSLELALRTVRGTTADAQADLGPLLRDLRATVSSLRDTAEALRRSPSQSLFGAPPPPPRERR